MEQYYWQDQKNLKNLFESEIGVLQRGLGGDWQLFQLSSAETRGNITALGVLKFVGGEQGISITFPPTYPYSPPIIIPVDILGLEGNYSTTVKHFQKGNQYENGSMCLFRKEIWDKNEHNIGYCLRRAQEWLMYATSSEGFPANKKVEESPLPMRSTGQVLMPKDFTFPFGLNSGIFTLSAFKNNHYILEQNILSASPFPVYLSREAFTWYKLPNGIRIASIIQGNVLINLQQLLFNSFGLNILTEGNKGLALFLPDEPNPWYFFKISSQQTNEGIQAQIAYLVARNIDQELYLRTKDVFSQEVLKTKTVTIVGLGAIGSEVGKSLARNAVGTFNLFDHDTLEVGNIVRHAADLYYIGDYKTEVLKSLILKSNPNIAVNTYNSDVLTNPHLLQTALERSDLCIVLTAEDSVDYFINDYFMKSYKIPFIFGRVSAGGMSGSIQIVSKGKTACLRCLSHYDEDRLPTPRFSKNYNPLPPELGSCSSPAVPGSEIDTKEVAIQVSRIALQVLLEQENNQGYPPITGHQFYWHGPAGSDTQLPFTWEVKEVAINKECHNCHE